jgi:hypothetical protein
MTTEMQHMYVTMPKALLDEIDRLVVEGIALCLLSRLLRKNSPV